MTAPIPAEWIKAGALAISRYDWNNTLSANGEVSQHQRNEAHAAIAAALPLIVESIAARFDERAHAAERATQHVARTERDVDAVMAWWSGARLVREHAAGRPSAPAAAVPSPGGTPGARCPSRIAHESRAPARCHRPQGHGGPHGAGGPSWTDDNPASSSPVDHPHTDPGDGRTECERCGKYIWPAVHSCKGIPVTAAARARAAARSTTSTTGGPTP